jgi:hypothetical protein
MSEKLTVRTAKKISRKLENGIPQILRDQSVPFFRKNAKEFSKRGQKLHTFSGNRVHKCALLLLIWALL